MEDNAKGEAPGTRPAEGSQAGSVFNQGREKGVGRDSSSHEHLSIGTNGTTGTRQNPDHLFTLTGGVIEQLILDAEDRLKVAEECVNWYLREKEKELSRLDNLKKLHQLADQVRNHQQPE